MLDIFARTFIWPVYLWIWAFVILAYMIQEAIDKLVQLDRDEELIIYLATVGKRKVNSDAHLILYHKVEF